MGAADITTGHGHGGPSSADGSKMMIDRFFACMREAAWVSRGDLSARGLEGRHNGEPRHGDETAVGRPQLGRSSFERHQRDLQIEDSRDR